MSDNQTKNHIHVRFKNPSFCKRNRLEMTSWANVMLSSSRRDCAVILRQAQNDNTILALKALSVSSKHDRIIILQQAQNDNVPTQADNMILVTWTMIEVL